MGKAIILKDSDFSGFGIGVVTPKAMQILPSVSKITSATTFRVEKDGTQLTIVSWAISDNTLASLVNNGDGTCTVTPLAENNTVPVQLSATASGKTTNITFVPNIPTAVYVWHIDRCTASPSSGSLSNANLANGGWAFMYGDNALLQGKKINRIKLVPSQAGDIEIHKAQTLTGPVTKMATITVQAADIGTAKEYSFTEFTLGENEWFVLGKANSAGGFKYLSGSSNQNSFYSKVPSSPSPSTPVSPGSSAIDLNISVGFYGIPDE